MLIKTKEITQKNTLLSHMILNCLTKEVINDKIESKAERTGDTEYDIVLMFEGVELDIRLFTEHLDKSWDSCVSEATRPEAEKMFEELKHTFISKNSTNAKLESIRKQMIKVNEQMLNINNALLNL